MASSSDRHTVLVTGGSGYLARWVIVHLLDAGYRVRATLRDLGREAEVRASIAGAIAPGTAAATDLAFARADLLEDRGWAEAVAGCAYVVHVATPMQPDRGSRQDIVAIARAGTRRVLEAAARAGVRRVVLTSSGLAALPAPGGGNVIRETQWTERPDRPAFRYARAKTLAERDAWAFVGGTGKALELTTILPGFILGPVLGHDYSASIDVVGLMLRGKMPATPRIAFSVVDARDLARLHVLALASPVAAGQRFLAAGEALWFRDIAALLRERLGAAAAKAPTKTMPDWLVRLAALVNPQLGQLVPDLGVRRTVDASKAQRLLGWATRPAAQSVADAGESLIAHGLV